MKSNSLFNKREQTEKIKKQTNKIKDESLGLRNSCSIFHERARDSKYDYGKFLRTIHKKKFLKIECALHDLI